jgi:hypothetical protein
VNARYRRNERPHACSPEGRHYSKSEESCPLSSAVSETLSHFCALPSSKSRTLRVRTLRYDYLSFCLCSQILLLACILPGGRRPDAAETLAGNDKLLGSQELTFAFVSVANALTLTYVVGGYLGRRFASRSNGGGRRLQWRTAASSGMVDRALHTAPPYYAAGHERGPASPYSGPGRKRWR